MRGRDSNSLLVYTVHAVHNVVLLQLNVILLEVQPALLGRQHTGAVIVKHARLPISEYIADAIFLLEIDPFNNRAELLVVLALRHCRLLGFHKLSIASRVTLLLFSNIVGLVKTFRYVTRFSIDTSVDRLDCFGTSRLNRLVGTRDA